MVLPLTRVFSQNLCPRVSLEKCFSSMKNYFKFPYCFIFIFVILQLHLLLEMFVFLFESKPSLVSLEEKKAALTRTQTANPLIQLPTPRLKPKTTALSCHLNFLLENTAINSSQFGWNCWFIDDCQGLKWFATQATTNSMVPVFCWKSLNMLNSNLYRQPSYLFMDILDAGCVFILTFHWGQEITGLCLCL